MGKRERIFKVFLVIYGAFMLLHTLHLCWDSWIVPASLLGGFLFALAAHKRHGVTTYLIVVHMGLECISHARHGFSYPPGEVILHGVHACLDVGLLYHAVREHVRKAIVRKIIYTGVFVGLGLLSVSCYRAASNDHDVTEGSHDHSHHSRGGPVEPFVYGGIFGCIFYHLRKKEDVTERA